MIPKVVHKVVLVDSMKLPDSIPFQGAIDSFKKPGYTVKVYSGEDCIEYIKKNFDERILTAFIKVRPYSFKCDLFRYLVLYKEGGWYSDMRQVCLENLDELDSSNHEFYCALDAPPNERCMYTAFIGSVPGHPILKKTFELICWNIEHEHYGEGCLYPTGPGVFMSGSIDYIRRHPEKCNIGRHILIRDNHEVVAFGKKAIVQCKYNNARGADNSDIKGGNDYGEMWRNWTVY